jgi:hypothetical protein
VIKRLLLALLLAWTAIAPAIANSCAAGCESVAGSMHRSTHGHAADNEASNVPDCHGTANERGDSNVPDDGSMEIACLIASAASLPSSSVSLAQIDLPSESRSAVLLPPLSFQTSGPTRPPQA